MDKKLIKEIYISVDVEADGPVPGRYSMTALGAVVAGYMTESGEVVKLDVTAPENRFYAEIAPISDEWVPEAMKVGVFTGFDTEASKLDTTGELRRAYIIANGEDPEEAMTRFAKWVEDKKAEHDAKGAIFAAYPLGFDWMWTYWYLVTYSSIESPFGHSRHIDIKTLHAARAKSLIVRSIKTNIPRSLRSKLPHLHLAWADAAEQGELLMNILEWEGKS